MAYANQEEGKKHFNAVIVIQILAKVILLIGILILFMKVRRSINAILVDSASAHLML